MNIILTEWAREAKNGSNTNREKYMDYHNNHIGRATKYQDFKSGNKSTIANTVKTWVDEFAGSEFTNMAYPIQAWASSDPSKQDAQDFVNNKKYKYKYVIFK